MNDKLFKEMLKEIDAMSPEEYWSLYREAESLADFPTPDTDYISTDTDFIPIQFASIPVMGLFDNFDRNFDRQAISISHDYSRRTILDGEKTWLKVA